MRVNRDAQRRRRCTGGARGCSRCREAVRTARQRTGGIGPRPAGVRRCRAQQRCTVVHIHGAVRDRRTAQRQHAGAGDVVTNHAGVRRKRSDRRGCKNTSDGPAERLHFDEIDRRKGIDDTRRRIIVGHVGTRRARTIPVADVSIVRIIIPASQQCMAAVDGEVGKTARAAGRETARARRCVTVKVCGGIEIRLGIRRATHGP